MARSRPQFTHISGLSTIGMQSVRVHYYPPIEEKLNVMTHAFGLLVSIVGLVLLLTQSIRFGTAEHIVSAAVFGLSLVVLYGASTVYHSARQPEFRSRMRVVDHASIFFLIAGSYTPFTLITLDGRTGWIMFAVVWTLALAGVILKLSHTGKYRRTSTLMYVLTGWVIVFAIEPLVENMPPNGLAWLIAGGAAYTTGAILYIFKSIRFNHAIFHVFVLIGSASHFISVLFYVLPRE